jgi:hypothetical protein
VDDPAILKRHPIFICVNNDAVGRGEHYGLGAADLVYEYIVDGFTLTRITAMYQSQSPERVGPVRSARYPNLWILYMYDGVLGCSGGSDAIRYLLKNEVGFPYFDVDLDDPSNNVTSSASAVTIGHACRAAPMVSAAGLPTSWKRARAIPTSIALRVFSNWTGGDYIENEWARQGFTFSESAPEGAAGAATVINIPYPGGNNVEWRYDAALGGYLRWQGGSAAV